MLEKIKKALCFHSFVIDAVATDRAKERGDNPVYRCEKCGTPRPYQDSDGFPVPS